MGFLSNLIYFPLKLHLNNKASNVKDYFLEKKSSFNVFGIIKKYTIGLPSLILGSFKNQEVQLVESEIFSVSEEDQYLFDTYIKCSFSFFKRKRRFYYNFFY